VKYFLVHTNISVNRALFRNGVHLE